jgi:hypothetical protein
MLPWYISVIAKVMTLRTSHVLYRPLNGQGQVTPSLLQEHCRSHRFLGPCCLCPLFELEGQAIFAEAAMYVATSGPFSREYIAQCAKGECGYLGQSLFSLE